MINGAHVVVYSTDADADRAFFRDVLGFPSVDAGHGWLIFALPEAEAAFHPVQASQAPRNAGPEGSAVHAAGADGDRHELYLMCDDVRAQIEALRAKGVNCPAVAEERWGSITRIALPGGGRIGLYQPKHPRP